MVGSNLSRNVRHHYNLVCSSCGANYFDTDTIQECDKCGGVIIVNLDLSSVTASKENLDPRRRMWQFSELLPLLPGEEMVSLGEGGTPLLWRSTKTTSTDDNGTRSIITCNLAFKVDYMNPTCSFKDRGASLLLTKARTAKADSVVIDSSGNAAAAVSAYSAKASVKCHVFVPEKTSPDKVRQISAYGASLTKVRGTREDVLRAAKSFAAQSKSYYCGFQFNPFASEASKTVAWEIAQQTNWEVLDYVIAPMGTGGLLIGCAEGFSDLLKLGWIARAPRMVGIQAEGCAPLVRSFQEKKRVAPINDPHTIAEGLKIGHPYKGEIVLQEIVRSCGVATTVTDSEIIQALNFLARNEGLYLEPSGAVSVAGFLKLSRENFFSPDQRVVCILTGSGLKSSNLDVPSKLRHVLLGNRPTTRRNVSSGNR